MLSVQKNTETSTAKRPCKLAMFAFFSEIEGV